ncbi:MAG: hypothetical protein IKB38_01220 [Clostridia bacterium]|nr:hypothetical protein [Clostridia bacterium]
MKILTIGEIIWDVYPDKKCIGGAPLNFAAHTALLGAEAAMVSAVGDDDLGNSAVKYITDFGVSTKFIKKSEKTTGICDVTVNESGVPSYSVRRDTAYDNIVLGDPDTAEINSEGFDLFYFGTLIQRSPVSERAVKKILADCKFKDVICDVNLRPDCYSRGSVLRCLENATILKISDEEEPLFRSLGIYKNEPKSNEEIAKSLTTLFPNIKTVIITMGAKGSFAYGRESGKCVLQPAKKVSVASTVGAGDSFAAAFSVAYLSGKTLEEAMAAGAELSGFVCSRTEAVPVR